MTTLEARREQRRATLLAVGVELLGSVGRPAVTVRSVCSRASLTERYFYENFTDRDTFVRTVYREVAEGAREALVTAVGQARRPDERARRAVTAFVELMIDEPARGRVLLTATFVDPALSTLGMTTMPVFVSVVGEQLESDEVDRQLTATGVVGALTALFTMYLDGGIEVDRQRFVDHCIGVVTSAGRSGRRA
ncbi:TetR/AcrR family transcriptional regulator [Rhodococcus sp. NBC_00297]|uniref:TetR/AcrR family transcriptional regulator n=1 Tax=Rhodococcus sp. NBC_00297 TaxID=2976005 RepID=UPI002E288B90|nr:TetR/AcrR family transcriptional regulator [Rhodococcus sp. NBC_00297]